MSLRAIDCYVARSCIADLAFVVFGSKSERSNDGATERVNNQLPNPKLSALWEEGKGEADGEVFYFQAASRSSLGDPWAQDSSCT